MNLYGLILIAYDIAPFQISGLPGFAQSVNYEVQAVAADPTANSSRTKLMLQSLLADRFKLVMRRETKEMSGYALVVAKGGPHLQPAASRECRDVVDIEALSRGALCHYVLGGGSRLTGQSLNIGDMVNFLSVILQRPVMDQTGIAGDFDIKPLTYSLNANVEGREVTEPGAPSLFTALEKELGLRLESRKTPVEMFVVERADRPEPN